MIALQVNGRPVELNGPTPLPDYLRDLGIDARAVAVEVNGEILQRDQYPSCTLREGDVIEIVRMVGGGRSAADHAPNRARHPPACAACPEQRGLSTSGGAGSS